MSKSFWDHPLETLEKALHIRKQIEALERNLSEIYSGTVERVATKKADGRKGKRSPATRARMAAAQRARWAGKKSKPAQAAGTAAKRKKMGAKSRAKRVAAQRARRTREKLPRR